MQLVRISALIVLFACVGRSATAAELILPSDPAAWITKSTPFRLDQLKGKGIYIVFFDEECPKCRARWPGLIREAKNYEDKPIVFLAINSGTKREALEKYVQEVNLTWPVVVDENRELEKAAGIFPPLTLTSEQTMQVRIVTASGEMTAPQPLEPVTAGIDLALKDAQWKVDPRGMPDRLKTLWRQIEFGNYAGLAVSLKKELNSKDSAVKEFADSLQKAVEKDLEESLQRVETEAEGDKKWRAYEMLLPLFDRFKSFTIPKKADQLKKDLAKDSLVKEGIKSQKSLPMIRQKLLMPNLAAPQRLKLTKDLQKIIQSFPDSDLGREAERVLADATK